jgi:hypothetical protein
MIPVDTCGSLFMAKSDDVSAIHRFKSRVGMRSDDTCVCSMLILGVNSHQSSSQSTVQVKGFNVNTQCPIPLNIKGWLSGATK